MKHSVKLFLGVWAVYFFCAAGYIDTIDADASIELASSMLYQHRLSVEPVRKDRMIYAKGKDGKLYSKMGLGTALIYIPVVAVSDWHRKFFINPSSESLEKARYITPFYISLVNGVLCALIVLIAYWYFMENTDSLIFATLFALALGFGTYLFSYSKSSHREPLQALCLLGAFLFPTFKQLTNKRYLLFFLGGSCAALGLLTKFTLIPVLIPAFIALFIQKGKRKEYISFFTPVLLALFIQLYFSYLTFGNWWSTGYSKDVTQWAGRAWSTPFWSGLWAQTFAPESGIIFFNPLFFVITFLLILKILKARLNFFHFLMFISVAIQLVLHSRWWSPTGNNAFGPRYCITILPLLILFLRPGENWLSHTHWPKVVTTGGILICVLFEIIQVAVKPQQYWALRDHGEINASEPHWVANFRLFYSKLQKDKLHLGHESQAPRSFVGLNFWWAHLYKLKVNPGSGVTEWHSITPLRGDYEVLRGTHIKGNSSNANSSKG